MRLDPKIEARGDLSGWVLVESELGNPGSNAESRLMVRRGQDAAELMEVPLPLTAGGRIHELVQLPGDTAALEWDLTGHHLPGQARLHIRAVGRIECALRMANRALRNWLRLSAEERSTTGLTLSRVLFDLPGAYRIATGFRGSMSYSEWVDRFDTPGESDLSEIRRHIERLPVRPHFRLIVWADGGAADTARTLASLQSQLYQDYDCSLLEEAAASPDGAQTLVGGGVLCPVPSETITDRLAEFNGALSKAQPDTWIMVLRAGDALPAHALYWFACEVVARPDAAVIYADDDVLDADGPRRDPRFKPDWSLTHLRATDFVGRAAVLRAAGVAAAGGVTPECCRYGIYDLLLRVADAAGDGANSRILHAPTVLLHQAGDMKSNSSAIAGRSRSDWQLTALRSHLARRSVHATVFDTRPGCRRLRFRLPEKPPLVSIIVPTRDALALLRQCLRGILQRTTYPAYEILVVDNQTRDPHALEYLAQISTLERVRVLRYDHPFNFSAINNFAAHEARGEALCLLNNDTEVISPDWLEEMVGHLLQPQTGVVGAKLYFPDGRVQHAGDTVGPGGCANHLHAFIDHDAPGYCNRAAVAQELSAVTAACLVTWRGLYGKVGGLDEKRLPVAFNDVDYCLRVRAGGHGVVWTPHAELIHHESVSRGTDASWRRRIQARREVMTMRRRWNHVMRNDPFYNPNLNYRYPDFSLSRAPRVRKPWRSC